MIQIILLLEQGTTAPLGEEILSAVSLNTILLSKANVGVKTKKSVWPPAAWKITLSFKLQLCMYVCFRSSSYCQNTVRNEDRWDVQALLCACWRTFLPTIYTSSFKHSSNQASVLDRSFHPCSTYSERSFSAMKTYVCTYAPACTSHVE